VHPAALKEAVLHHALAEQEKQDENYGNENELQDSEPMCFWLRVVRWF
jgi:hypothetical protein